MTRTLLATICLGVALGTLGCVDRRFRRDYDRDARYERHDHDGRYGRYDRENRVDINRASERQLERLPGLSEDDVDRIIANRPYQNAEALVRRGVLGPRKYQQIEDYVYAGGGRRGGDDDRRRNDDYEHRRYYDR